MMYYLSARMYSAAILPRRLLCARFKQNPLKLVPCGKKCFMVYWFNTYNNIEMNKSKKLDCFSLLFTTFSIPFSIPCDFLLVVPRHPAGITQADVLHPPIPRFVRANTLDRGTPFEQAGEFGTACKVRMVPGVRVPEETFDRKGWVAARGGGEEGEVSVFEFAGIMGRCIAHVVYPDVVE